MIGQAIGRYRLLERIGAGGMGVVYRAQDLRLGREVAVKVLPEGAAHDEAARRRFRHEAEAVSRLNHPNIATIHDFEEIDGTDVLVMEFIPGETLRERLERGPIRGTECQALAVQLVEGLAAAHAAGVLHRDLKPGNVRVTPDGRLKILDFGLARLLARGEETRTDPGTDLRGAGTLPYAAPEQIAGEEADERADVYAAGATLYEMVLGQRLFAGTSGPSLLHAVLSREPVSPRQADPTIPPAMETLLLKAIDKDPARRYQSARELLVDLHRLEPCPAPAPRPRRPARRLVEWTSPAVMIGCLFWISNLWPQPRAFPERGWVLVADLENHTGDPQLAATVRNALELAVEQSHYVNVVARDRTVDALRRMAKPANADLSEAIGLEICRREGFPVLLGGAVFESGHTRQLVVKAIDAGTGQLLFAQSEEYDQPDELFSRVDKLGQRVRSRLGDSMAAVRQAAPLAQVATPSFDALRQYSIAVDARARGEFESVEPALLAALSLDPDFVMAHLELGDYYASLGGSRARSLEHLDRAYALRGRVTERERLFVEASYYSGHEQWVRMRDSFAALVRLYPEDPEYRYELGRAYFALGDLTQAVAETRESLARDPYPARVQGNLILLLALDNRPDEALDAYRAAVARGVESPLLVWGRGLAEWGRGDLDAARDAFASLAAGTGFYQALGRLHLARLALYQGQTERALAALAEFVRIQESEGNTGLEQLGRSLIARTQALLGRTTSARREVEAVLAADRSDLRAEVLRWIGVLLAEAGDLAGARTTLGLLAAHRNDQAPSYSDLAYFEVAGQIALAEGRAADAVDDFLRAGAATASYHAWRGLALARERLHDTDGAIRAWERVLAARGEILRDGFPLDWGLAELALARQLDLAGRSADACAHYAAAVTIWNDGSLTTRLDEARGRMTSLGCAAAPSIP